jgi:diguanylate cyclase (GGDEF)-like protein/PAS domain S-box-containing protein
MSDGVYFVDNDRRILYWNQGAFRLTGYTSDEILGRCCQEDVLCHVDGEGTDLCQNGCPLSASIQDGGMHEANVYLRHKQGRRVPVNVRVQPMNDANGQIIGAIEIFSDDTAQNEVRRRAETMKRMAFIDHLTQLPNRRFLEMSIQTAHDEFKFHQSPFAVLLIDLDRFKRINDSFGHVCGDRALNEVAATLSGAMRPADNLGRWGGDEFLAIVRNIGFEELHGLVDRCVALVTQTSVPWADSARISLSISVGAALSRLGETPEDLIRRADSLMYASKSSGRGRATVE